MGATGEITENVTGAVAGGLLPVFGALQTLVEVMSIADPSYNPQKALKDGDIGIVTMPSTFAYNEQGIAFDQETNYYRNGVLVYTETAWGGEFVKGPAYDYDPTNDIYNLLRQLGLEGILKIAG
jgi:hypothetical protein